MPVPELPTSTFAFVMLVLVFVLLASLYTFNLSIAVPGLSAYNFQFFDCKFQPKYKPRAFMLSKKLINIASCLLS